MPFLHNIDREQVYAPANAANASSTRSTQEPGLPVVVWIHGGGYGEGSGAYDLTAMIVTNNNSFIGVDMNYRVSPLDRTEYLLLGANHNRPSLEHSGSFLQTR